MGLVNAVSDLFFIEHNYKPINGDVCFIGRQTTYLEPDGFARLINKHRVILPADFRVDIDKETMASTNGQFVDDKTIIRALGGKFHSIDVSEYEGADFVADLSVPIPKKLRNRFDFIYEGSCLDNIFNPAQAIINCSTMLRPGGRMMVVNHADNFSGPYTMFSVGWFFDYFCANRYADCQVYLVVFSDIAQLYAGAMPTFYYNWKNSKQGNNPVLPDQMHAVIIVIAEKGEDSTNDVAPVQFQYRDRDYQESVFSENAMRIESSARPVFGLGDRKAIQDSFAPCGLLGAI